MASTGHGGRNVTKRKTSKDSLRLGSLWGEDKEGKLPLKTKPLMGNAIKPGNISKKEREK